MPIVAQKILKVDAKDTGVVDILQREIYRCGCVDLAKESEKLKITVSRLLAALQNVDGVVCDKNVCCAVDLSEKLKRVKGGM